MNLEFLNGDFTGYYSYGQLNDVDHEMLCSLVFFQDGRVVGHGVDDIDPFHFEGKVDLNDNSVVLIKQYPGHQVQYIGTVFNQNNAICISGTWTIQGVFNTSGTFSLKKGNSIASIMADITHIEQVLKQELQKVEEL